MPSSPSGAKLEERAQQEKDRQAAALHKIETALNDAHHAIHELGGTDPDGPAGSAALQGAVVHLAHCRALARAQIEQR